MVFLFAGTIIAHVQLNKLHLDTRWETAY